MSDTSTVQARLPVLYSFRRCPYAMRARLGLAASGVKVELREVLLRDKPAHMLELSPKGTVPVLWLPDGSVIDESLDILFWALRQHDPCSWLELDETQSHEAAALIKTLDGTFKHHLDRYKYPNRYAPCDPLEHRQACLTTLKDWNARLQKHGNLVDEQLKYVDVALLPFVRQFCLTDALWFETQTEIAQVQTWLKCFMQSRLFDQIMRKLPPWRADAQVLICSPPGP